MKRIISYSLVVLLLGSLFSFTALPTASAALEKQNNYPIVLVHGFAGFGEILGIPYWGWSYNIPKDLKSKGYETIVVSVGPFSSDWDRSCELYAQLVGGTVDYGKVHSEKYGHARYGRTYTALYPKFGTTDKNTGYQYKIHLLGHSMGGPTVRTFATMMEKGNAEERNGTPADELSPFFEGTKGYIGGVMTLASPGDGTTGVYGLAGKSKNPSFLQQFVLGITSMAGGGGKAAREVYDVGLDQWGFTRDKGESLQHYLSRIESSDIWNNTHDLSVWDLKPDGARELNSWVTAQPDIYYFSQGLSCTRKGYLGYQVPDAEMNPMFYPTAFYIGSYTQKKPFVMDKSWWENDGLVSVATADGPRANSPDQIVPYQEGQPQIGKWNYLGTIENVDHFAIIGGFSNYDPRPLFRKYAEIFTSLPE